MMLIYSLLLALLRSSMGEVSPELREKLNRAEIKMRAVQTLANNMATDESTRASVAAGGTSITEKSATFGRKWVKAAELRFNKDPERNAEKIGKAITGVGNGMVSFASGIKNKDWISGVQGALTMISSVLALAGPKGMIASAVLSVISSLFSLFRGKSESMDDKLARIIDEAREKDLKADVEGLKVAYESLSNSVEHFRESERLEEDQANELYNHAFMELPIFGKLLARIKEICDNVEAKNQPYAAANKCLTTFQMYVEVSVLRQLLLTNMASLMADVHEREHGEYVRGTEHNNEGGLLVVSNNLLNLIKKEKEKERLTLSFITDPFNNPDRRYIISVYFSNPDKYSTLKSYLRSLHDDLPGGIFMSYSMVCKDRNLQGNCLTLTEGNYADLDDVPEDFRNSISSFYVPLGLRLTAWQRTQYGGTKWGPYAGPIVHGSATDEDDYDSIRIESTTRDAENEVRFCQEPSMALGRCDTAPIGTYDLRGYNGYNWEKKLRSMYVPAGLAVTGYTESNYRGRSYWKYVGPFTFNLVYNENSWRSIKIYRTSEDAREDVQICDEENFGGHCIVLRLSTTHLSNTGGINFKDKVHSLKIPGGMHISGYTGVNMRGNKIGPYQGPASITKVDEGYRWESLRVEVFANEINN